MTERKGNKDNWDPVKKLGPKYLKGTAEIDKESFMAQVERSLQLYNDNGYPPISLREFLNIKELDYYAYLWASEVLDSTPPKQF